MSMSSGSIVVDWSSSSQSGCCVFQFAQHCHISTIPLHRMRQLSVPQHGKEQRKTGTIRHLEVFWPSARVSSARVCGQSFLRVSLFCRCTGAHHRHVRSFVAKLLEAKQFGEGPAEACTKHLIGDAEKAGLVRWKAVGDKERDCGEEAEVATGNFSFESASRGGYTTCVNCCAGQVFRFPAVSGLTVMKCCSVSVQHMYLHIRKPQSWTPC